MITSDKRNVGMTLRAIKVKNNKLCDIATLTNSHILFYCFRIPRSVFPEMRLIREEVVKGNVYNVLCDRKSINTKTVRIKSATTSSRYR